MSPFAIKHCTATNISNLASTINQASNQHQSSEDIKNAMNYGYSKNDTMIRKSDSPDFFKLDKPKMTLKELNFFSPHKEARGYFS